MKTNPIPASKSKILFIALLASASCIFGLYFLYGEFWKESVQPDAQQISVKEFTEATASAGFEKTVLAGNQAVAPKARVELFVDPNKNIAYMDCSGLPPAPKGKTYQLWAFILDPPGQTSIGLLERSTSTKNIFFKFENVPAAEAFGLTLEPENGSEAPTLSKLYVLGMTAQRAKNRK